MYIFFSLLILLLIKLVYTLKKTYQSSHQMTCLLENTIFGYIFLNSKLKITRINIQAYQLLGIKDKILYQNISHIIKDHKWASTIQSVIDHAQKTKQPSHLIIPISSNHEKKLELLAKPLPDKTLILKINEITSEESHITMGKNFIASASHELRTPITIIKGFAETLKEMPKLSENMFDTMITKIIASSERMELLIKNLLILADLDSSSTLQKNSTELVTLINSVSETIVNLNPTIHIEHLHNQDSIQLHSNEALIELALINLMQNAIKFSPQSNRISIKTTASSKNISIAVQDFGMGIPSEKLNQIFEKFHTVNKSHSRKLGGAGLGLSIVKNITDKHSATISVESKIDQGSTFTLNFPNNM